MKTLGIVLFCIFVQISSERIFAQSPCKEYKFNDLEMALMNQYITSCIQDHWFVGDKGVAQITRYTNDKGQKCWYLSVLIDDRYKDNPPTEYAWSHGDLVLIYEADNQRNKIRTTPTKELLACLEEVVLDKLYIRPSPKDQYITMFGKRVIAAKRSCLGRCANDLIVVFNEDGTYTKVSIY